MTSIHAMKRLLRGAVLGFGLAVVAAGCDLDSLLEVDPVDRVPAEGLTTQSNALLLVNGAIADFECAYGAYVALSGVVGGELIDATQTAARWPAERRDFDDVADQSQYATFGCTALGIYIPLQTARWSADNILFALQGWTDAELSDLGFDRQELLAKAAAYAGYSYVLLGEGFCSMAVNLSAELTPAAVFDTAIARFTTAIAAAQAAGEADLVALARVGRARAYLNRGQGANAVADAEQVPAGFEYVTDASGAFSVRSNRIFAQNGPPPTGGSALSIGEAYRNFQHMGVDDPRVEVSDFIRQTADGTELYFQLKYESLDDPLPLATWEEAQLIIAEAQLGPTAVAIINDLHSRAGIAGVFVSTDNAQILAHVLEERQAELWLEGHRFNDIERHNLDLVPAPGTVYRKGQTYEDARCFPLPDIEIRNNPNI
ncbi:MAG TPA: RagB/SusD family nutrient uptake outer membrane protein [Longimicrobiales bacterium]|nr:RagB/SusD family nutrient uptake outer membrane protein [Longimicrobiales bacterium]